jgi:hypothetical protein
MIIANVKYQSPKGKGAGQLKGILRYLQYRNDRGGHIPQQSGLERWTDHGLGGNFQTIAANCEHWKSEHVQAFTWVLNPNPDLIAFVPEAEREAFTRDLTENTLAEFLDKRDLDIQWSYVLHRRDTTDGDLPGRDNPHTHVILPGTYESWADGGRLPFYMNRNKREDHIELLHQTAQTQMATLLERHVGLDWEQRYDALISERQQPFEQLRQQSLANVQPEIPVPEGEPHGTMTLADGTAMQVWVAIQDDLFTELQNVGFICRWEDGEAGTRQHFIPKVENVSPEYADQLSDYMIKLATKNGLQPVITFAEEVQKQYMIHPSPIAIDSNSPGLDI